MAIYKYNAISEDGEKISGSIFANDYRDAFNRLCLKKKYPTKIKRVFFLLNKVDLEDLLMLFMHIDFQLKCGSTLDQSIESFTDFYGNKLFSSSMVKVLESLKKGESISESFESCGNIFSKVIIGLLKSAQSTGEISVVVQNILNFLKLQAEWKSKVKRAIAYPLFIVLIAIVILILSITLLGPQVISLINDFSNVELPFLTVVALDWIPAILQCIVFGTLFVGGVVGIAFINHNGIVSVLNLCAKIPLIGQLISKITVWYFCKVMQMALSAKLTFADGLNLAIDSVFFYKSEFLNISEMINNGATISEAFATSGIMPNNLMMTIYVSERGNDLLSGFKNFSETQYQEILYDIKSLGRKISVSLTLFAGAVFVFILCSLFYPIYNYIEVVGG